MISLRLYSKRCWGFFDMISLVYVYSISGIRRKFQHILIASQLSMDHFTVDNRRNKLFPICGWKFVCLKLWVGKLPKLYSKEWVVFRKHSYCIFTKKRNHLQLVERSWNKWSYICRINKYRLTIYTLYLKHNTASASAFFEILYKIHKRLTLLWQYLRLFSPPFFHHITSIRQVEAKSVYSALFN